MLLRLSLRRHASALSPTHNHAPSLCDALIRRGRQIGQQCDGNQRGRQLVNLLRQLPAANLQPLAVSRQPSAASRQPPAVSPSPERREATAKPSEPFIRPLTRPARGKRPQAQQPFSPSDAGAKPVRTKPKPRQPPTQKVINISVNNLLITC